MRKASWFRWLAGWLLFLAAWNLGAARFAVLSDVHVSPGNPNESVLAEVVREINGGGFDFVLVPGDLTNQGSEAELDAVKKALDELRIPVYAVPGNHETNWSPTAGQGWIRRWGSERVDARAGQYRILGISSGPYMKMGDAFVRADDLLWLRRQLQELKPGEEAIVVVHYPVYPGLGNYRELAAVLQEAPVAVVVGGHWHRSKLFDLGGVPNLLSRSLLRGKEKSGSYGIVELTPEKLEFTEKTVGVKPEAPLFVLARRQPESWRSKAEKVDFTPAPTGGRLPSGTHVRLLRQEVATIDTAVAADAERIYYGSSDGFVNALDRRSGKLLWRSPAGGALFSTPVVDGGRVAAGCVDNRVRIWDAATGKELHQLGMAAPVSADGAVRDGMFYIGDSRGNLVKIELASGKLIWSRPVARDRFQARPLVTADAVYAGAWDGHLYKVDAATGETRWKWTHGKPNRLYSPGNSTPLLANQRIFVATPDRYLNAIDAATGKTVWRNNAVKFREAIASAPDGKEIYAKTMDGELAVVPADSADGAPVSRTPLGLVWEHTPTPPLALPPGKDGSRRILTGLREGSLVLVDDRRAVWRYLGGVSAVNGFGVAPDGKIYATLIEGRVYEITLP